MLGVEYTNNLFLLADTEGMKPPKPLDSVTTAPLSQLKKIFLLARLKYGAEAQFAADAELEASGQPKLEEDAAPSRLYLVPLSTLTLMIFLRRKEN